MEFEFWSLRNFRCFRFSAWHGQTPPPIPIDRFGTEFCCLLENWSVCVARTGRPGALCQGLLPIPSLPQPYIGLPVRSVAAFSFCNCLRLSMTLPTILFLGIHEESRPFLTQWPFLAFCTVFELSQAKFSSIPLVCYSADFQFLQVSCLILEWMQRGKHWPEPGSWQKLSCVQVSGDLSPL